MTLKTCSFHSDVRWSCFCFFFALSLSLSFHSFLILYTENPFGDTENYRMLFYTLNFWFCIVINSKQILSAHYFIWLLIYKCVCVWECCFFFVHLFVHVCVSVELSAMKHHSHSYSQRPVINITIKMLDTADGYKILLNIQTKASVCYLLHSPLRIDSLLRA